MQASFPMTTLKDPLKTSVEGIDAAVPGCLGEKSQVIVRYLLSARSRPWAKRKADIVIVITSKLVRRRRCSIDRSFASAIQDMDFHALASTSECTTSFMDLRTSYVRQQQRQHPDQQRQQGRARDMRLCWHYFIPFFYRDKAAHPPHPPLSQLKNEASLHRHVGAFFSSSSSFFFFSSLVWSALDRSLAWRGGEAAAIWMAVEELLLAQ